jgi:hypothetical protein
MWRYSLFLPILAAFAHIAGWPAGSGRDVVHIIFIRREPMALPQNAHAPQGTALATTLGTQHADSECAAAGALRSV